MLRNLMSLTKVALALSCGTASAHWDFHAKQFSPLVLACDGVEMKQNCTASFSGVCNTAKDGERFCSLDGPHEHGRHEHGHHEQGHHEEGHHEHGHHEHHEHYPVVSMLLKLKHGVMNKLGFHCEHGKHHARRLHGGPGGHRGGPRFVGDCAKKADGESCSFARQGRCIPSGKCPVFQGKTVCKPWDSHPPRFVTQACAGKTEGATCWRSLAPGACAKLPNEDDLVCKTGLSAWLSSSHGTAEEAAAPATGSQSELVV